MRTVLPKIPKQYMQIGLVVAFLIALAFWIYTQNSLARIALGGLLAVVTLGILWMYGIFGTGSDPKTMDRGWQTVSLFFLVAAMLFTLFSLDLVSILTVWILVMILFVIFLATLGVFITGRAMGLFINSRNRMAIATLQTILWTVVILSAFFTVVAAIIQAGEVESAFNIQLDERLWILLGISVTTLAGTPLIHDVKSRRRVSGSALKEYLIRNVERIRRLVAEQNAKSGDARFPGVQTSDDKAFLQDLLAPKTTPEDKIAADDRLRDVLSVELDGPLWKAESPKEASVLDLFRGDEGPESDRVDLGKVQMFFFTVVGALAYMIVLGDWISTLNPDTIVTLLTPAAGTVVDALAGAEGAAEVAVIQFPILSEGFVAILGISHAGFLGNSAANKM